jgi:hypothetical protein
VSILVPVVVIGVALAVGLVLNGRVRPFADSEIKGVKLEALVNPLVSLSVLILAFTLVQVFSSYQRAQQGASDEARKVDLLFELGGYVPQEAPAADLQAATACYAAAVAEHEWDVMAEGRTAPQVSPWTAQIRGSIDEMVEAETPSPVLSAVLTADKERGEARSRRLTEARPSLPDPVFWLLVLAAAVGVFALATFTLPYVARRVQLPVLCLLALMLSLLIACTRDLDRPYDGVLAIGPTDMERVAADLVEDWSESHPDRPLPCTADGSER